MNRIVVAAAALACVSLPAYAADAPDAGTVVVAKKGKMLVAADGARLAPISRVADSGPQIILDGRMVTVPMNTVAMVGGKLQTSLTKAQVLALR